MNICFIHETTSNNRYVAIDTIANSSDNKKLKGGMQNVTLCKYAVWKFHDFSFTHILREIKFTVHSVAITEILSHELLAKIS